MVILYEQIVLDVPVHLLEIVHISKEIPPRSFQGETWRVGPPIDHNRSKALAVDGPQNAGAR